MAGPTLTADQLAPYLRLLLDSMPTPSMMVRADHPVFTFMAANDAYIELVGVNLQKTLGRSVFDLFPDDLNGDASRTLGASLETAISTRAPDRMPPFRFGATRRGGVDWRYFKALNTPLFDAEGEPKYIIHAVEEITEQVATQRQLDAVERQLQTSEKRFRQLAEISGFGFLVGDQDGAISYVNSTVLKLLEYTAEEVAGGLVRWDQITPPEFAGRDAEALQELLSTGTCVPFEKALIAKGGRRIPILIAFCLLDPANDRTQIAAIVVDLTERKHIENTEFLVQLDDATRALSEPDELMETAVRLLGEHLHADRCGYCIIQPDTETLEIRTDYRRPGVFSLKGTYQLSQFGTETVQLFRANLPDVVEDTENEPGKSDARAGYRNAGIRAHVSVPLHKAGKLVAAIGVHQLTTRKWLPVEVALVQVVANRCWESIERVRATQALLASERRLRLAQKAGRIGTFEWVIRDNCIAWSPELEALYDLPEGAFEGNMEGWRKRSLPEEADRVMAEIGSCLEQRKTDYVYELRAVLPDGTHRWLRGQAQIFYDDSGPTRMLGVNIDVDAQKRAEAHLQQQWHTFDTVLSNTPDAIYIFDREGRFLYANQALLSQLNIALEDVTGKDGSALGYSPDIVQRTKAQIQEVFRHAQPVRDEMPLSLPDGETRYYEYILAPVLDADGKVESAAGSTRDITERKVAAEQELKRQEQLRESAHLESLGIMAGGIAHDFNNLLTGILGNASLLAEGAREQDAPFARDIVLGAERAAELTSQMLAYSGRGRFLIETLDLNSLLEENLRLLRASLPHTVTVELELSDERCCIEGDRAQMQQVVMNLLLNAAEAVGDRTGRVVVSTFLIEQSKPQVSARLQTPLPAGSYVVLEVRDNGSGMAPETLKRIFDPFFTTKFTGRGLGLAAVLGIVKGHHGDIEVESEPGTGTLFRVSFPATQRATSERAERLPIAPVGQKNLQVLVVDDEELVRRVARSALESQGLCVTEACGGPEALDILRNGAEFQAVILDLTMPVMRGEEAVPLIQEMRPDAAIILSSGYSEAEVAGRFELKGIAGFLQKPYTASAILDKVRQVLAKNNL